MIFNPPYVETETDEKDGAQEGRQIGEERSGIDKAWAGGIDGMEVTEKVLEIVELLLSERGLFYLVTIPQNKPHEIIARMNRRGLLGEVVLKRRAGGEHLHILRFERPPSSRTATLDD